MKQDNKGIIYVLTNPVMPGLIKIGMTKKQELDQRLKELYTTGVPMPFECEYACEVDYCDCDDIENALHNAFEDSRVNKKREFFKISPERVIPLLQQFEKLYKGSSATELVKREIENDLSDDDKQAQAKERNKKRRPPMNYHDMGIANGATLVYIPDPNITAEVCAERKVLFKGEETSLTAITKEILHKELAVQPGPYWSYNGEVISDIYDRTYPFEEE